MGDPIAITRGEPLRLPPAERAANLLDHIHRAVDRSPDRTALTWRPRARGAARGPGGRAWRSVTYAELWAWVERTAAGLEAWGVGPGDRFAIMSRSRPEWMVCDLAALSLGAVTCPIYHAEREQRAVFILANTDARFAVLESALQARRTVASRGELPRLERVAVFDAADDLPDGVTTFEGLVSDAAPADAWRTGWRARWMAIPRDAVATIVHTSGTTDNPKGVILTHGNVVSECELATQAQPFGSDDEAMSVLPLSHIAERAGGQMVPLGIGASVTFAEPVMERWPANLLEIQPTIMVTVPTFFSRIHRRIRDQLDAGPAWKRSAFDWATRLGTRRYANHVAGRRDSPWLRLQLAVANRLVFRPIKERVGGRLRFFLSGAAPLPQAIGELFYAMDMLILEAYGLTETSAVVCMNRPEDFRFGTVGRPFPETEIRIDPETGEILARGPQVFQGYLNLPDDTAAAIDPDGWFHTGDVGEIDDDGRLRITDRIKNILVLANGKKVMPGPMENVLAGSRYIAQSVILGDHHEQTGALVVPDLEHLAAWATEQGIGERDLEALSEHPTVIELIEREVRHLLGDFAAYERPRRIAILPRELSEEADELTPLRKPKRRVVIASFPDHVARLFEGERREADA
jgi:long-chain acyl-CoA synthetase